jgi:hypothetical protein
MWRPRSCTTRTASRNASCSEGTKTSTIGRPAQLLHAPAVHGREGGVDEVEGVAAGAGGDDADVRAREDRRPAPEAGLALGQCELRAHLTVDVGDEAAQPQDPAARGADDAGDVVHPAVAAVREAQPVALRVLLEAGVEVLTDLVGDPLEVVPMDEVRVEHAFAQEVRRVVPPTRDIGGDVRDRPPRLGEPLQGDGRTGRQDLGRLLDGVLERDASADVAVDTGYAAGPPLLGDDGSAHVFEPADLAGRSHDPEAELADAVGAVRPVPLVRHPVVRVDESQHEAGVVEEGLRREAAHRLACRRDVGVRAVGADEVGPVRGCVGHRAEEVDLVGAGDRASYDRAVAAGRHDVPGSHDSIVARDL